MAKIAMKLPDEKMADLEQLSRMTVPMMDAMLDAGGRVGKGAIKQELQAVIGSDLAYMPSRTTDELLNSVGVSPPDTDNKTGVRNVNVGFNEPRRDQGKSVPVRFKQGRNRMEVLLGRSYNEITNVMIAHTINYGKRHKSGINQDPKPFMKRAKLRSRAAVKAEMEKAFREKVKS